MPDKKRRHPKKGETDMEVGREGKEGGEGGRDRGRGRRRRGTKRNNSAHNFFGEVDCTSHTRQTRKEVDGEIR